MIHQGNPRSLLSPVDPNFISSLQPCLDIAQALDLVRSRHLTLAEPIKGRLCFGLPEKTLKRNGRCATVSCAIFAASAAAVG